MPVDPRKVFGLDSLEELEEALAREFSDKPPADEPLESFWASGFADGALMAVEAGSMTSAGVLLSDADPGARHTRPYEVPPEELRPAQPWGDEPMSQLVTAPVELTDLPGDAFPTQVRSAFVPDPFDSFLAANGLNEGHRVEDSLPTVRRQVFIPSEALGPTPTRRG